MNDKCWVLLLLYIISECGIDHNLFVSGHLEVTEKCSRGKLNNFFPLLLQNIQQKPLEEGSGFFLAHNLEAKSIMAAKGASIWSYYIASSTGGLKKIDAGT